MADGVTRAALEEDIDPVAALRTTREKSLLREEPAFYTGLELHDERVLCMTSYLSMHDLEPLGGTGLFLAHAMWSARVLLDKDMSEIFMKLRSLEAPLSVSRLIK
eukprot:4859481-Prymnesium_polylepis.1